MGLGPIQIPLNFENNLDHCLDIQKNLPILNSNYRGICSPHDLVINNYGNTGNMP